MEKLKIFKVYIKKLNIYILFIPYKYLIPNFEYIIKFFKLSIEKP